MDGSLPELDRHALREALREEFERTLDDVSDAIDNAPMGKVIRESEEPARDALDRFRKIVYEKAMQMKIEAAEAAFSPSGESVGRKATE